MNVATQPQKILILSANPKGTSRLRLDEEIREIKQELLKRASQRDLFSVESAEAVRYRDIYQAILDYQPQIIHFSGHGAGEDGLIFEDEAGQLRFVDAEALSSLFELFAVKSNLRCVVLNACYSEVQAKAIAQSVNYVVGMDKAIGDKAAIEFAVGFYSALGAGEPVDFAHKLGCIAIRLAGIPEYLTPKLLPRQAPSETLNATNPFDSEILEDILTSDHDVDYSLLRDLLEAEEWKEADQETTGFIRNFFDFVEYVEDPDCLTDLDKLLRNQG